MNKLIVTQTGDLDDKINYPLEGVSDNTIVNKLVAIGIDDDDNHTLTYGVDTEDSNRPITSIKGNILVSAAKSTHLNYIEIKYPNLTLNAITTYMYFEDPEIELYLIDAGVGDSSGVTLEGVRALTRLPVSSNNKINLLGIPCGQFYLNENVVSFNELGEFTSVTNIPGGCFYGATNFLYINLSNINTIESSAFRGSKLTGIINLPKCNSIGPSEVRIGNSLFTPKGYSFYSCEYITKVNIGSLVLAGFKLSTLSPYTFMGCISLEQITGLEAVTSIGFSCFMNCSTLTNLPDLNSGLLTVEGGAFKNDSNLICVDLRNVTSISDLAFLNCTNLIALDTNDPNEINNNEEYTLKVTSLENAALLGSRLTNKILNFPYATSLKGLSYTGIKEIKAPACTYFLLISNCPNLRKVTLGNVTSFSSYCFYSLSSLTEIVLGNLTTSYNSTLDMINLTYPLVTIPTECFLRCTSLFNLLTIKDLNDLDITKNVNLILSNATTIERSAFYGCKALKSIEIPLVTELSYLGCFNNCIALQRVYAPLLTIIGPSVFYDNSSLSLFDFTNITSLGTTSFKYAGLLGLIDLGANINNIGENCFENTSGISGFIIRNTTPPTLYNGSVFGSILNVNNGSATKYIYVPDANISDYETAWSSYTYSNRSWPINVCLRGISLIPSS